jgi:phosphopantetheinyl transferase (holo-ACP synthase)
MMILHLINIDMKVGCDIITVARFIDWTDSHVRRIFKDEVYEQWVSRNRNIEYLAGRWALKEAVYKCCGKLENITNDLHGKPNSKHCSVSLSHDNGICFAIAICPK